MIIQSWADVLIASLQDVWAKFLGFLPNLIGALIVFIVGLIVATGIGALVERIIDLLRVDVVLEKIGLRKIVERGGLKLDTGRFIGQLVYWLLVIAFFLAAADILHLYAISDFLRQVILYIPNIIIAALILVAAVLIGDFLRGLVRASVQAAKIKGAEFLGTLTWWVTIIFGILAALVQLGIAVSIINTILTGFVAMVALAGGLAFGLGGKDYATSIIEGIRKQIGKREEM